MSYRQLIIVRKDLNMSPGKLAAQVAHASWAFFSTKIRDAQDIIRQDNNVVIHVITDAQIYDEWFCGIFTKTVCEAKNHNALLKAKAMAEDLGLKEGRDFFLIKDSCLTELRPEEIDENGIGRTLTCIGFRPLPDETVWKISKKYQLYK